MAETSVKHTDVIVEPYADDSCIYFQEIQKGFQQDNVRPFWTRENNEHTCLTALPAVHTTATF